jgi:outer membrane receptor for ferrienterochelin and colicins
MNEITYDSVYIANEFILDADIIDRIEISRGPSSSLYGDNAFFAIINIFTRRGRDFRGAELSASAGSLDTYKGRTSYGNRFESNSEMVLSGTALDSKGDKHLYFREFDQNNPGADPRAANNGVADNLYYEKHHSFFAKYSSGEVSLEGAYVERDKGIPTASYGAAFDDSRNHTVDGRAFLDLKYEHEFAGGFKTLARVYYDQMWYHADLPYPDPLTPSATILNYDQVKAYWMGAELQLQKDLANRHRIVAGVEYQDNMKAWFENHDYSPYVQYIDSNHRSTKWALYAQDEYRIARNLILNAGVRHDHYETCGATTNPRLGLIYNPAPKSTIKFLYDTAFRSPNAYELYWDAPAYGTKGNPELDPEKITTYELVYEQYAGNHYLVTLAGFENRIKGLIIQETDPTDGLLVFKNRSDVKARGLEAELEGKWESGFRHKVSYTYTQAKDEQTGEILANSPAHMAKANSIFPIVEEKLFAGVEVQYLSRRKTVTNNYASSVVLTNVTLFSRRLLKGLEVSGTIYDLFNKQYGDPGGPDHQPLDVIPRTAGRTG